MFRLYLPIILLPGMIISMQLAGRFIRVPSSFGFYMVMTWIGLCAYTVLAQSSIIRRAFSRASERDDVKGMRRALGYLGRMAAPWQRSLLEASLLMKERRFGEARETMLAIDRNRLTEPLCAVVDNNIAWCLVQDGDGASALPFARAAVRHAKDEALSSALGTLGAALHLCGESLEALEALDRVIGTGKRQTQAIGHYYRGECLHALGRQDEAARAFSDAIVLAPESEFGRRARSQLQALSLQPYR